MLDAQGQVIGDGASVGYYNETGRLVAERLLRYLTINMVQRHNGVPVNYLNQIQQGSWIRGWAYLISPCWLATTVKKRSRAHSRNATHWRQMNSAGAGGAIPSCAS